MELPKERYSDYNRDDIVRYFEAGGEGNEEGLMLSPKQKHLVERWDFAASKIREQRYKRYDIVQMIMNAYHVSRDTAMRDMVNAEYVFAASYPFNKPFLIQNRIEFLQKKINDAYIDKDYQSAAMLEKVLQKYIEMYPQVEPLRRPQKVIMVLQQNIHITNITHEQAYQEADAVIKQLETYGDTKE